jgi:membrane protein
LIARLKALRDRVVATVPGRTILKFGEDQAAKQAVVIAWNAMFAMFPILLVMAGVLGFVLSFAGFKTQLFYQQVVTAIPDPGAREQVLQAVDGVKTKSGVLFVVGLAVLFWSGSALFGAMEDAFDVIFHAQRRGFIQQRLMSFGMIVLFTVLAGLTILTSSVLPAVEDLPFLPSLLTKGPAAVFIQVVIGVVAGVVLFTAIYRFVPNRRQRLGSVLPGALVAGVLFEALTLAFPIYLHFTGSAASYGKTFGLLFVLLTFFYFLGLITMLGVELNSVLYPVPVEQPDRAAALAPAGSGPEGESEVVPSPAIQAERAQQAEARAQAVLAEAGKERRRRGIKARSAVAMAGLSSLLGLLIGRRSGKRATG